MNFLKRLFKSKKKQEKKADVKLSHKMDEQKKGRIHGVGVVSPVRRSNTTQSSVATTSSSFAIYGDSDSCGSYRSSSCCGSCSSSSSGSSSGGCD